MASHGSGVPSFTSKEFGGTGTGGKELFYLEEFRNMRPKSYGRHFETELSIGNMGKYDKQYSL